MREDLLRIRSVREDDWPICLELEASFETESAWQMEELHGDGEWGVHFREVRLPRKQIVKPFLSPELRLKGWQNCAGFWVAVDRRNVVGYIVVSLEPAHQQMRVTDLVVAPASRRQGAATDLLLHATEWAGRQGMKQVILQCALKAQPAIGFAMRRRFVFCGYQDGYWPDQEVGIFFRKRIR